LVPVIVVDRDRLQDYLKNSGAVIRAELRGDRQFVDAADERLIIPNLSVLDFQVFEDGKEQTIRNVTYEKTLYWDVSDNIGHHTEYIGPGGGKWSTVEWPP